MYGGFTRQRKTKMSTKILRQTALHCDAFTINSSSIRVSRFIVANVLLATALISPPRIAAQSETSVRPNVRDTADRARGEVSGQVFDEQDRPLTGVIVSL